MFLLYTLAVANVCTVAAVQGMRAQTSPPGALPEDSFGFCSQRAPGFKEDPEATLTPLQPFASRRGEKAESPPAAQVGVAASL